MRVIQDAIPIVYREPTLSKAMNFLKVATLCAEVALVTLVVQHEMLLSAALGLHAAVCMTFVVSALLAEAHDCDSSSLQKFGFLTSACGPIGSAAALIDDHLRQDIQSARLDAWYKKIAPVPQNAITLVDRLLDDRLVRADAGLPQDLDSLLKDRSVHGVQAFLASIAADGQPQRTSLLGKALGSDDQRIRVQSAAVAAYLRDRSRSNVTLPAPLPVRQSEYEQNAAGTVIAFPIAVVGSAQGKRAKS